MEYWKSFIILKRLRYLAEYLCAFSLKTNEDRKILWKFIICMRKSQLKIDYFPNFLFDPTGPSPFYIALENNFFKGIIELRIKRGNCQIFSCLIEIYNSTSSLWNFAVEHQCEFVWGMLIRWRIRCW